MKTNIQQLEAENRALKQAIGPKPADDVTWRVELGLTLQQAEQAARFQKRYHTLRREELLRFGNPNKVA